MVQQSVRALEVCFCALAVLSVSPRAFSTDPEPIRTGLWVTQRVADELNGSEEKVWANPYLTGVRLTANWNEIEKGSGKIDFSGIDKAVASSRRIGRKYVAEDESGARKRAGKRRCLSPFKGV
jgi:hypothetical protein